MLERMASNYFEGMTKHDLFARHAVDKAEYKNKYFAGIIEFTENEKNNLKNIVKIINRITRKFSAFRQIKWKFAKLRLNIENGFPHTLGDTIFLPETFFLVRTHKEQIETIVHEKVHIFQRTFPFQTNALILRYWGCRVSTRRDVYPRIRANPDLNGLQYSRNNEICYKEYNKEPSSVADAHDSKGCINSDYEHPYEKMAYIIADIIVNKTSKTDDYIQVYRWMSTYF